MWASLGPHQTKENLPKKTTATKLEVHNCVKYNCSIKLELVQTEKNTTKVNKSYNKCFCL